MLAFRGRSGYIIKLKNKPIKEEYENWVLAEYGYVWNWLWYSILNGTEGAHEARDVRIPKEFPDTQTLIMRLALTFPHLERDYILYLDNLFMSVPFANALREYSIEETRTTRKNSSGIPKWLLNLKQENRKLIFNSALGQVYKGENGQEILVFL